MHISIHTLLFALSAVIIWCLSGMLIDATDRVAKRYKRPGFAVAFLILGLLTSVSEFSVASNATLQGTPQVSAGNLLGASTVIFLFIIPLLAVLGNGIMTTKAILPGNMVLLLGVVLLPCLLALDGDVSRTEGVIIVLLYLTLVYRIQKKSAEKTAKETLRRTKRELLHSRHTTGTDLFKIIVGALLIFAAGNILVQESVYFAGFFWIPVYLGGVLLLSIGRNVPGLVIELRWIFGKPKDIAFGDYMGSAAANSLIFGFLPLANGTFILEQSEVAVTSVILAIGLLVFFVFSRTRNEVSRIEGNCLLVVYAIFIISQIGNAVRLSDQEPLQANTVLHASPL